MRTQLIQYVDLLFAGSKDSEDIHQEILQNTLARYDDLILEGKTPEAAYRLAILGIGEKLIDFPEADKTYRLMNNGVLFIMDSRTQVVITAYVPSIKKVAAFYRSIGVDHIPPYIYNIVKKNMQNKELKKLRWMYED